MSDQDEWTISTLKQYFDAMMREREVREDQRHAAQQTAVANALASQEKFAEARQVASEKAILKAEVAAEKRFDSVNEFRQTLTDQAGSFMPRAEADAKIAGNAKDIMAANARLDKMEGQAGGKHDLGWLLFSAGSFIFGLVGMLAAAWTLLHH